MQQPACRCLGANATAALTCFPHFTSTCLPTLSAVPAGALQPRKRKKEETDNVDALAKQYVAKYFGGAAPKGDKAGKAGKASKAGGDSAGAKAKAAAGAAMKRWFE